VWVELQVERVGMKGILGGEREWEEERTERRRKEG
jgi:hypothetical protein